MTAAAILLATARFAAWEAALFAASSRMARLSGWDKEHSVQERALAILAIEVTLESSFAALFSFSRMNSPAAYWTVAALCAIAGSWRVRLDGTKSLAAAAMAALAAPLILLSFRPVEEIDSINYLHFMIDWMANRATPYTFSTNYVAFWELSFLPSWIVTRVDLFFPLVALKAVVLLGLALWLVGRELGVKSGILAWTVFAALLMRHYWYQYSGVPTLKNDVLHGAGFALLTLAMTRAVGRRRVAASDVALLGFGVAFASVKYTGIFFAVLVVAIVAIAARLRPARLLVVAGMFLFTSGHYYVNNLVRYGSPFYPFQLNLGPIHLPGTADLSYSSILYNLHDSRLWRAFFLPQGGVSPAGVLFPVILAAVLLYAVWCLLRAVTTRKSTPGAWVAFALLCGWLLYFRSVYSACAWPGDLHFVLNQLNSLRYVDGVLAVSEVFLVWLLGSRLWLAALLVAINGGSRLLMLYHHENLPGMALIAAAGLALVFFSAARIRSLIVAALIVGGPFIVEINRAQWTTYWNDLKPALGRVRGSGLAELGLPDGGYFAGHIVAAGNPVNPAVQALEMDDVAAARPRYLALLITPASEAAAGWQAKYGPQLTAWGYRVVTESRYGALLERREVPVQ